MPRPLSALAVYESGDHAWWETAISDIRKNHIVFRGHPVESLVGNLTYTQMAIFMATGRELSSGESHLLEALLVAGCDHGPRAPSIAATRMAATCGVTFNSAIASGINLLGHYHGGAGEDAMTLFYAWQEAVNSTPTFNLAEEVRRRIRGGEVLPGFGHQLHTADPRVPRLRELAQEAAAQGVIGGRYLDMLDTIGEAFWDEKGRRITPNIDGISAAIQCELGLPAEIAQGLFILSRSIGLIAHAFEQSQQGVRVKGPCPPGENLVRYTGAAASDVTTH